MKQISDKRAVQLRHYNRIKAELEQELKARGEWVCVFSGIPIPDYMTWKEISWHHLNSRTEDMLTDKKFVRPCADKYHTGDEGFHNHPISELKKLWWWQGFLQRVKAIDKDLWYSFAIK